MAVNLQALMQLQAELAAAVRAAQGGGAITLPPSLARIYESAVAPTRPPGVMGGGGRLGTEAATQPQRVFADERPIAPPARGMIRQPAGPPVLFGGPGRGMARISLGQPMPEFIPENTAGPPGPPSPPGLPGPTNLTGPAPWMYGSTPAEQAGARELFNVLFGTGASPVDQAAGWQAFYTLRGQDPAAFARMIQEFDTVEQRLRTEFSAQMGLSGAQLYETMRQYDLTTAEGQRQFNLRLAYDSQVQENNRVLRNRELDDAMTRFDLTRQDDRDRFRETLGLDRDRFNEMTRQFDITTVEGRDRFREQIGLERDRLAFQRDELTDSRSRFDITTEEGRRQFAATHGLDIRRVEQMTRQFDITTAEGQRQFDSQMALSVSRMNFDRDRFTRASSEFDMTREDNQRRFAQTFGLDERRVTRAAEEFDVTTEEGRRQFNNRMVLERDRFSLERDRLDEESRRFGQTLGEDRRQFNERLALDNMSAQLDQEIRRGELQVGRERQTLEAELGRGRLNLERQRVARAAEEFDITTAEGRRQFGLTFGLSEREMNERVRQFNINSSEGMRQFNERLALDQFNATIDTEVKRREQTRRAMEIVLNAPRGPADIWSYAARLAGLYESGELGRGLGAAIQNVTSTPLQTLATGPVLTNTQLTSDLMAASRGQPVGDLTSRFLARTMGVAPTAPAAPVQPVVPMAPAAPAPPRPTVPTGFTTSAQEFARLDPSLRAMYMGLIQEQGGEMPEDFLANLRRGAPGFARSRTPQLV